jgi:hypothetical protein
MKAEDTSAPFKVALNTEFAGTLLCKAMSISELPPVTFSGLDERTLTVGVGLLPLLPPPQPTTTPPTTSAKAAEIAHFLNFR